MAKKRATNSTAKKQQRFLEAFAEFGNITHAAQAAGIDRGTHYKWLDDEGYAERFDTAEQEAIDALEAEARRRALDSSDTLLIFLMKSRRPELYRERHQVEHTGEGLHIHIGDQWEADGEA